MTETMPFLQDLVALIHTIQNHSMQLLLLLQKEEEIQMKMMSMIEEILDSVMNRIVSIS